MVSTSFFSVLLLALSAQAVNDWSKPCFDGSCSYDLSGPVTGSVHLTGASSAISDLTEAAGWAILDCNSTGTAQDIRATCVNSTAGCDHLYQGNAVGTIVRLPENCTTMPFARVANIWDHDNQTSPLSRRGRFSRRDDYPTVKGISLDTSFSAIDPSEAGSVSFFFHGTSAPNANTLNYSNVPQVVNRDLSGLVSGLTGSITREYSAVLDPYIVKWVVEATAFDKNITQVVPNITESKQAVIFNESIACPAVGTIPPFTGQVSVEVDVNANMSAYYGVIAAGSVVPPEITTFALYGGLNGFVDGALSINSSASASIHHLNELSTTTLSTGAIPIFSIGIPGLDIPGILTVGPTFQIAVEATAALDIDLDLNVGFNYTANNAQFVFPDTNYTNGGDLTPGNTIFQLAASPNATSDTTLTASLIPSISFGLNALDGIAEATVNLDLNAFTQLNLALHGNLASGNASADQFGGSVNVQAGINVTAGADGSFFTVFDDKETITLFSKTFELFQKTFGSNPSKRMSRRRSPRLLERGTLTCPVALEKAAVIANTIISASQLEEKTSGTKA
ncbi:uncharacterized protein FIBRA_04804 [Fibroporia radiculosa]|uniref:DUF7223 domain-containing protein n=1 Tax=Fibroporia radiculosa TaxID=599839 RepID=J4G7Z6_9APHY|nr:uncharacterized protein FIBRA_04804 [Fibroporia radiculosa]CCM02698.1 predicted protein [Fibroporia radiculosa]